MQLKPPFAVFFKRVQNCVKHTSASAPLLLPYPCLAPLGFSTSKWVNRNNTLAIALRGGSLTEGNGRCWGTPGTSPGRRGGCGEERDAGEGEALGHSCAGRSRFPPGRRGRVWGGGVREAPVGSSPGLRPFGAAVSAGEGPGRGRAAGGAGWRVWARVSAFCAARFLGYRLKGFTRWDGKGCAAPELETRGSFPRCLLRRVRPARGRRRLLLCDGERDGKQRLGVGTAFGRNTAALPGENGAPDAGEDVVLLRAGGETWRGPGDRGGGRSASLLSCPGARLAAPGAGHSAVRFPESRSRDPDPCADSRGAPLGPGALLT